MALALKQGDEVTVLYRKVKLTPQPCAEENRQISGCRSGKTTYLCIVPSQIKPYDKTRWQHVLQLLGVCGSAAQNVDGFRAILSTDQAVLIAFCAVS